MLVLWRLRQVDYKVKASQGYIVRPYVKETRTKIVGGK
jgi:hypothetical protein